MTLYKTANDPAPCHVYQDGDLFSKHAFDEAAACLLTSAEVEVLEVVHDTKPKLNRKSIQKIQSERK